MMKNITNKEFIYLEDFGEKGKEFSQHFYERYEQHVHPFHRTDQGIFIIDGECFLESNHDHFVQIKKRTSYLIEKIELARKERSPIIYLSSQNLDTEATNDFYTIGLENTLHLVSEIIVSQYEKSMIIRIPRKVFDSDEMPYQINNDKLTELIYYISLYLHANNTYKESNSVFDFFDHNQDFEDFVTKYKLISIGFPKEKEKTVADSIFKPTTPDFVGNFTFLENAELALHMMETLNLFLNRNINALSEYI